MFIDKVINKLEKGGFMVIKDIPGQVPNLIGVRKSTGKKVGVHCIEDGNYDIDLELKLSRIWTLYDVHPFIARARDEEVVFFDIIYMEDINAL